MTLDARPARLTLVWVDAAVMGIIFVAGGRVPFGASLLLHAAAYIGFGALIVAERRHPTLTGRDLVAPIGLLLVAAVVVAPIQSTDIWSYAIYGRMTVVHHVSPYHHVPAEFTSDRFLAHVAPVWRHAPSVYGPLFTLLSAGAMKVAGGSALTARLLFQGLAAMSAMASLVLIYRRTGSALAVAVLGLNPIVVIGVVNAGHNDALVGLLLLLGVLAATDERPLLAGLALGAAVLIKLTAGFPLAAIVVWCFFRKGWRPAAGLAAAAGTTAVGGLLMGGGTSILGPLQSAQLHISGGSLWRWPAHYLIGAEIKDGLRGRVAGPMVRAEVARWAAATTVGLTALVAFSRRRDLTPAIAAGAGALIYVLVGQYVQPWYLAWALPCLALAYRSRFVLLGLVVGAVLHLVYVPDTHKGRLISGAHPGRLDVAQWTVRVYFVPVLILVAVITIVALAVQRALGVSPKHPGVDGSAGVAT